ncbi:M6 family metalloprotease domain-containing protein [Flocculibacter collagenilyticus]|uniref:M6 family metalloprotease domain-containing protein n=1 Tax=Flocculibacter collagenilyticus TaxID=2744479 RepID=UPI0018F4C8E2|nr:M6 family metalloprotease domain-containing protein [Flocculibacter collagenilyticus]
MCRDLCIMPPHPDLHDKIDNSKRAFQEGSLLDDIDQVDVLDMRTFTLITGRPDKTRAHNHSLDAAPVVGVRKALALLVDFSDKKATTSKSHFNDLLFDVGSNSMRDYYREVSYNKLDVQGQVAGSGPTAGWYRAPHPKSYYTNNDYGFGAYPKNAQRLVEQLIDLAAPHVNFANYDNSGNGKVEALMIICAGIGAEQSSNKNDFWSHKWSIAPKAVDGVTVDKYFMAPENGKVGVMSHELGHLLLGLPDLYDTDYSSRGTGRWDLMAGGSWNNGGNTPAHPTAWCKVKAGWITPTVIHNAAQAVTIKPYADNPQVYKLPIGPANSKEYFLLSNRKKTKFDQHIPGEGLIIEHIDDNKTNNTDENHYLVDIEQCDGLRELNKNINSGNASDAFPHGGNNTFNNASTPNSKSYGGADSKVAVTNIAKSGNNITANINVGGAAAKQWKSNVAITRTYTSYHASNCWAYISGTGWRKVDKVSNDGVTNVFALLVYAHAYGRKTTLQIDGSKIYLAYMN